MRITSLDIRQWSLSAREHSQDLVYALREKGAKHFSRPLMLAGVVCFAAYLIASYPLSQIQGIQSNMAALQASAQYGERYKGLKLTLANLLANVPDPKSQEAWLQNSVRDAMRQQGIFSTSLSQPSLTSHGALNILSVTVACEAGYKQLGQWIARLEASKIPLRISNLNLAKSAGSGSGIKGNSVTLTIDTMGSK